jgi:hypothetical protein
MQENTNLLASQGLHQEGGVGRPEPSAHAGPLTSQNWHLGHGQQSLPVGTGTQQLPAAQAAPSGSGVPQVHLSDDQLAAYLAGFADGCASRRASQQRPQQPAQQLLANMLQRRSVPAADLPIEASARLQWPPARCGSDPLPIQAGYQPPGSNASREDAASVAAAAASQPPVPSRMSVAFSVTPQALAAAEGSSWGAFPPMHQALLPGRSPNCCACLKQT